MTDGPADDGPARVQVPAPVEDAPSGADPVAGNGSDTGDGPAISNGTTTGNGSYTGDGPASCDGSATGDGPTTCDGLTTGDGPDTVDVSVVESSQSSALQFDDPAEYPARLPAVGVDGSAGHGTPAATTPGGGPDISMSTGTSSPLFPSILRSINQATLVDFMSLWTLLQRRMDQSSVPVAPACPPAQSSAPDTRHDSTPRRSATTARTPERRPRTPERFLRTPQTYTRTPDRSVRTSVRRARSCSESQDSRSSFPVSRSSAVKSPTWDGSTVNFTAAMDP